MKIYQETTGTRYKKVNVIGGYCSGSVVGLATYAWNTDTEWFCMWFEHTLFAELPRNSVIVLDNASFHSKKWLPIIAQAYGHRILWLPKYSPDKNSIEHIWATMKTWLRNYSKYYDNIRSAIRDYFQ